MPRSKIALVGAGNFSDAAEKNVRAVKEAA